MNCFPNICKSLVVLSFALLFITCAKPNTLQIGITMHSEKGYGIIVTKIAAHKNPELPIKFGASNLCKYYVYPTLPFETTNIVSLRDFEGIPHDHIPNYITFEYQYANINECTISRKDTVIKLRFLKDHLPQKKGDIVEMGWDKATYYVHKTKGIAEIINNNGTLDHVLSVAPVYYSRYDCKKWVPIEGKKFIKTIDLSIYQNSKAMTDFNKKTTLSGNKYRTAITYKFYDDDEIKLDIKNYNNNPWK